MSRGPRLPLRFSRGYSPPPAPGGFPTDKARKVDRAEKALRVLLKLDPECAEARTNLAVLIEEQRKMAFC